MLRALALAAAALAGCGATSGRDTGADRLARSWAQALASDDPRAAYDLLAASIKAKKSYATFASEWKASAAERARQTRALHAALDGGARLNERGDLALIDGQTTPMTRDPAGWRLERPLVSVVRPATPEDALRRLADALDERSFPAVLRLLSSERQEAARDLLEAFVTGLRAHAGDLVEVTEDRATVVWSDGSRRWRVVLKREQGAWRIDDFSAQ